MQCLQGYRQHTDSACLARQPHLRLLRLPPVPGTRTEQAECTQLRRYRRTKRSVKVSASDTADVSVSPGAVPPCELEEEAEPLEPFLSWLLANGVQGIGAAGKIALYEGEDGERGVLATEHITAGAPIVTIPLQLAITDYVDVDEVNELDGSVASAQGQPWSLRLAARLLAMQAQGAACPWRPYLRTLPRAVPCPLTAFSWEDIKEVQYPPMLRQLDHTTWLAADAVHTLGGSSSPDLNSLIAAVSSSASGGGGASDCSSDSGAGQTSAGSRGGQGYTRELVDWALSVVHSRSFGAPGKEGAVSIRMLVPLVDMLNHAGDVALSAPGAPEPTVQAYDNVRWDLRPMRVEGGQEWSMVVSATRDVEAGEELLLSYGERSNDDFFLHYGFVPPRNPHDSVVLFADIESAIEHWLEEYLPKGVLPPQELQAAISSAYTASEEQDSFTAAAESTLAAMPEAEAEAAQAELAQLKLFSGGRVDRRLLAAYRMLQATCAVRVEALQCGWEVHVRSAVALRARQVLDTMPTSLEVDLKQLATWEAASGQRQHGFSAALEHYCGSTVAEHTASEPLQTQAGAVPSGREEDGEGGSTSILPVVYRAYKKMILWDAASMA